MNLQLLKVKCKSLHLQRVLLRSGIINCLVDAAYEVGKSLDITNRH